VGWHERRTGPQRQIQRLTTWARVGFAALCCERLLPAYTGVRPGNGLGDAGVLHQALDRLWAAIASQAISGEEARALVKRCLQQVPHLDDPFDTDLAAPAQNAAIAVLRTVECARDGDPQRPKVSAISPLTPSRPTWI
jgi:uncharacterized protein YjaG (DUF416 family)